MAKFSKKGWGSDFNDKNFTSDQLERHIDGLRDDLYGHRDPAGRRDKTVHVHPVFGEKRHEPTPEVHFEVMLEEARKGYAGKQYLVGLEYAKRGDTENAIIWLKKAADNNFPGASEALERLNQDDHTSTPCATPKIIQCKIIRLPPALAEEKYFLLVRVKGFPYWYHAGIVAALYGLSAPILYDSRESAKRDFERISKIGQ